MTTIGNIGIGLFILIILWILALIFFVVSVRLQSNWGWIILAIVLSITLILAIIPLEDPHKVISTTIEEKDYLLVYRYILFVFLSLSFIILLLVFFFSYCITPIRPKPLSSCSKFISKVMNSENPVIVNFHAEWCEPCHMLTPKMKELIEHHEKIDLAIVDVENHAELVDNFEVKAVPAVLAIKNGLVVDKFIGLVDSTMIENLIAKLDPN